MTRRNIIKALQEKMDRSAWNKAVTIYALEILEELNTEEVTREALLNGASDWNQYSWGRCSLIYNSDIAERICTPSELKKRNGGEWRPNCNEEWLDVQARALSQACNRIMKFARKEEA